MYLRRLDLIAFGPFTQKSLDLGPGFNIVYGDNEAGKSTTLRALRQLLFGIDHRCSDNYLHDNNKLRIGAVLEDDGRVLEIIRRKSRDHSLRAADDQTVIDPEELESFLDGLEAPAFQQRFGIDYEQLVTGGKEICEGRGDLGEILFAAASGVADLRQVQQQLAVEAGNLFKPSGSNPTLNQAFKKSQELRKQIKQLQLLSSDWELRENTLREANQKREEVLIELRDKSARKRRLEQLRSALPLVAKRQELLRVLAPLDTVPRLPGDFSARRQQALIDFQTAEGELETLRGQQKERQRTLEGLEVPDALLRHAKAIRDLQEEFGAFRQARDDRPGLAAKLLELERRVQQTLQDIGRASPDGEWQSPGITRQLRTRLQRLARDRKVWQTTEMNLNERAEQLKRNLRRNRQRRAELGTVPEISSLKKTVQRVQGLGDLESDAERLQREITNATDDIKAAQARLGLSRLDRGPLEQLPLPPHATIQRFDDAWTRLQAALETHQDRIDEQAAKVRDLQREIKRLRAEQHVPTEEELTQIRHARDEAWQPFRNAWLAGEHSPEARPNLEPRDYEELVRRADTTSDEMRRHADLVAMQSQRRMTCEEHVREKMRLEACLDELRREQDELHLSWRELWKPLGVAVLPPREMRAWADQVFELIEEVRRLRQQELLRSTLHEKITTAAEPLRQVLATTGSAVARSTLDRTDSLRELLRVGVEMVDEVEARQQTWNVLEHDEQRNREELEEVHRDRTDVAEKVEAWQREWSECMSALNLAETTSPEEAQTVLEGIQEILQLQRDAERERERIENIDQFAESFSRRVEGLLAVIAEDLSGLPVEVAMTSLGERWDQARDLKTRHDELERRSREDFQRQEALEQRLREARVKLEVLCAEGGCPSVDQLPMVERQAAERREAERDLAQVQDQLWHLAEGIPLDEFLQHAADCQPESLHAEIARLEQEIEQFQAARDHWNETIGVETTRLSSMDGSDQAAAVEAELANLRAQIRSDVEQYARLKLAAFVLRETIERYREKNQTPVLQRGSEIFRQLTEGAFIGLRPGLGEKGEPVMQGVRPDGTFLGVEGMSDGASDQLYLALRIASLEHYFQQRKSLPFIVDDVLVMFDDDRAVAALRLFAELAESCQVIFFTHHRHLLQLVETHLPPDGYAIHMLEGSMERTS